jgi:hypothetical protein
MNKTNLELIFVNTSTDEDDESCYWLLEGNGYRYLKSIVYESEEWAIDALHAGRIEWHIDGK